jgi:hypothetical protein
VIVPAGSRTLYLDLKQNDDKTRFLSISEVRGSDPNRRSRILLDEQYVPDLHQALAAVLELLKTAPSSKEHHAENQDQSLARAYKLWTADEDGRLKTSYRQGRGVNVLAVQHERAPTAIISRLYQLGILKPMERPRWD